MQGFVPYHSRSRCNMSSSVPKHVIVRTNMQLSEPEHDSINPEQNPSIHHSIRPHRSLNEISCNRASVGCISSNGIPCEPTPVHHHLFIVIFFFWFYFIILISRIIVWGSDHWEGSNHYRGGGWCRIHNRSIIGIIMCISSSTSSLRPQHHRETATLPSLTISM